MLPTLTICVCVCVFALQAEAAASIVRLESFLRLLTDPEGIVKGVRSVQHWLQSLRFLQRRSNSRCF